MVENNSIELTEQETELYDRQIRLWGLDSQKRLRAARILLCGLNGFGAEIAKNIILAGVKSITLLDNRNVSEADFCSQFLAPQSSVGMNRAVASLLRAQALNPMVEINVDIAKLDDKSDEYFHNFDVVVVTEATKKLQIRIDNACRLKGVKFFAGDVWGTFGYSFADLQEHNFAEEIFKHKQGEKNKSEMVTSTVKRTVCFPPLQDVLEFDHNEASFVKKIKRTGPSFIVLKVLQNFRETYGRDPFYKTRSEDLAKLLAIRNEIAPNLGIPDAAFVHVFAQISPVAAIVGGELAQEIIKAVSQKEAPHNNLFLFDPATCCGYVETIAN
ncbi:SUMO-activating enzyme subunit 1 [Bradysia coprophila]|uniref:SUMO-activating enzyme subunit 1 n=1 Tax=Bradysia coprophila TaxID=38358 RepID=UPI00187D944E|nr:SUMO-activating enzyme subunit 1 [Bradysia coprophila]